MRAGAALAAGVLGLALHACEGLLPGAALAPRLAPPRLARPRALSVDTVPRAPRCARAAAAASGILALRCQQEGGGQTGVDSGRQGSLKGPDPMAPYCTETVAKPTGELYESGDGTQVLQLEDGTVVLERPDGVQVTRVECSGFYCIDVEYFQQPGTESNLNTLITTVKVIVGGVAPLLMPWCIKNQGIVGGPLTVLGVGLLSQLTIKQLVEYRDAVVVETGRDDLTYVDVARHAFGDIAANSVFLMTIVNSLGVCAAYSSFIGSTMATLSSTPGNVVFELGRDISSNSWQVAAASIVLPLNALAGSPAFLSTVALLGAGALFVGVATTCWYGFSVTPDFVGNLAALPWFTSPQEYFTSFGVVPLLFCVHFAVLSIERNMKQRSDFPSVLRSATLWCVIANAAFGALGFAFFGDATDSVVLNNLGQGPFLTWVRLALVADMLVSYPVMLSSSREICENAVLGANSKPVVARDLNLAQRVETIDWADLLARNGVRSGLILSAFAIAQLNDVGKICNLVGGVFQVILAFVIPPALALQGSKMWGRPGMAAGVDETIPVDMVELDQDRARKEERMRIQSYLTIMFGGLCCVATLTAFFADVLSHS